MASKLALDNQLDNVGVRVSGSIENRTYDIIINCVDGISQTDFLVQSMIKQGFKRAHVLEAK